MCLHQKLEQTEDVDCGGRVRTYRAPVRGPHPRKGWGSRSFPWTIKIIMIILMIGTVGAQGGAIIRVGPSCLNYRIIIDQARQATLVPKASPSAQLAKANSATDHPSKPGSSITFPISMLCRQWSPG